MRRISKMPPIICNRYYELINKKTTNRRYKIFFNIRDIYKNMLALKNLNSNKYTDNCKNHSRSKLIISTNEFPVTSYIYMHFIQMTKTSSN